MSQKASGHLTTQFFSALTNPCLAEIWPSEPYLLFFQVSQESRFLYVYVYVLCMSEYEILNVTKVIQIVKALSRPISCKTNKYMYKQDLFFVLLLCKFYLGVLFVLLLLKYIYIFDPL